MATVPEFEDPLDRSPDLFATLEEFVQQAGRNGTDDERALELLERVQFQLQVIRYRSDRGYRDAAQTIDAFQRRLGKLVAAGRIGGNVLTMLGSALHQAGIVASNEVSSATVELANALKPNSARFDLAPVLEEMAEALDGDPFVIAGSIVEFTHAAPAQVRAFVGAEQARAGNAAVRDAAVLLLLDREPAVRRAVGEALCEAVENLSPHSLRRLIAIRDWRPESERPQIEAIINDARARGIACAASEPGAAELFLGSGIDGSGAQAFLFVSPAGRRIRLSSVLLKNGVRDAWTGAPEPKRKAEATLACSLGEASMLPVSTRYVDRCIGHQLALGLVAGAIPPLGLLQVAETAGAEWRPQALDWREGLAALLDQLPGAMLKDDAVKAVLRSSVEWGALDPIADSWFEDDPEVADVAAGARGRRRTKAVEYLLKTVLARRREKWAEHFLWTALWLQDVSDDGALPWREFALLARALTDGSDLSEITLMRDIAERTIDLLRLA